MREVARKDGFDAGAPFGMAYIPGWNVYTYSVESRDNVQARAWSTSIWIDGATGALVSVDAPALEPAGNRFDLWMRALHFGDLGDSPLYRAFVCLVGLATAALSVTGVLIWLRKRRAARIWTRRAAGLAH